MSLISLRLELPNFVGTVDGDFPLRHNLVYHSRKHESVPEHPFSRIRTLQLG